MNARGVSSTRLLMALIGIAIALAIAGALSFVRYTKRAAPNAHRIAVAPFDIFTSGLDAWRVQLARGLTDRVARIPGWTTVPQEVVAQRWKGQDRAEAAAVELARQTQAGIAIYGRVDSLSADSVRVNVLLIDVTTTVVSYAILLNVRRGASEPVADTVAAHIAHLLGGKPTNPR